MLDLGWQELFFITLVAIIVVGPKDLPMLVRSISRWIFKARRLAQDFQGSLEIVAREAEIDGLKNLLMMLRRMFSLKMMICKR
jgi:sec-independent protein translocase protein TatB